MLKGFLRCHFLQKSLVYSNIIKRFSTDFSKTNLKVYRTTATIDSNHIMTTKGPEAGEMQITNHFEVAMH